MASASTAATSQEALDAILCDTMPRQGNWSDEEYLWLTDRTRRLVEFTDGYVEELPMPTSRHQAILAFLYRRFYAHLEPAGGVVMFSALRLRVREGKFREPDLLVLRDGSDPRFQDRFWLGADLVAEIVSPDGPERDLVDKRADYAEAGISGVLDRRPATRHHHRADAQGRQLRRARRLLARTIGDLAAAARRCRRRGGHVRRAALGVRDRLRHRAARHVIGCVRLAVARRPNPVCLTAPGSSRRSPRTAPPRPRRAPAPAGPPPRRSGRGRGAGRRPRTWRGGGAGAGRCGAGR